MKHSKSGTPYLSLRSVCQSFSSADGVVAVLKHISFDVQSGEVAAIVGPSGSGKTTLLNIISGISTPDSGEVMINGVDITKLSDDARSDFRGQHLGFIFQDFLLLDHLSVLENIMLPIEMNGVRQRFEVDEILSRVGLLTKKNANISILSRGERQRVAIARAFIGEIPFLLADEPTGNLDAKNAENVMNMLLEMAREFGVTVLLVTHDKAIYERSDVIFNLSDFS